MPIDTLPQILASSPSLSSRDTARVVVLVGMLILAVVIMGVVLLFIRKNLFADQTDISGDPLTLHDIRQLHRTGQITDEEFERMKAIVIPQKPESHPDVLALKKAAKTDEPADPAPEPNTPSEDPTESP